MLQSQPANLLRQETSAVRQSLRVISSISQQLRFGDDGIQFADGELLALMRKVLLNYVQEDVTTTLTTANLHDSDDRFVTAYTPIVAQILHHILSFSDKQLNDNVEFIFPVLVQLIACDSRDLRSVLRDVFNKCIGKMILPDAIL